MSRPSDELKKYSGVLTISSSVGNLDVYKFIEKFLKVENEEGISVPFILREEQVDLYKALCEQKLKGEPMRVNILKARQIGFSTFIAAIIFVRVIFTPGQKASIVADTAEHASNLFQKYNFFYDNLPDGLKLKKVRSNAKELVVEHLNNQKSSIRIVVQGENAGRSGTYQYLHLSECAFWDDLRRTLVSLLQTVSSLNKESMVFFETTGNGFNDYKKRWDDDIAGKTPYKALFYSWQGNKAYRRKYNGFRLEPWEQELKEKFNLDNEQVAFYREKYYELGQELSEVKQEYPSSPEEAFKTTGASVFNADLLAKRKQELIPLIGKEIRGQFLCTPCYSQDGMRISLTNVEFLETDRGDLKIYKKPNPTHPYVINLDPAMGGSDYYAIQVVDNYTGEQVAVYHRAKVDDDVVAFQLICLGQYYNNALISAECNNPNGSYILQIADKCGYRNIYQDKDFETLTDRYADKFGYKTKQNNKNVMVTKFKIAFRDNYRMINDYETICEMEEFEIFKSQTAGSSKEQFRAISGEHDDLVMAMCGIFLIQDSQDCIPKQAESTKNTRNGFDPFRKIEPPTQKGAFIWD